MASIVQHDSFLLSLTLHSFCLLLREIPLSPLKTCDLHSFLGYDCFHQSCTWLNLFISQESQKYITLYILFHATYLKWSSHIICYPITFSTNYHICPSYCCNCCMFSFSNQNINSSWADRHDIARTHINMKMKIFTFFVDLNWIWF
jgi:hypothetical protein